MQDEDPAGRLVLVTVLATAGCSGAGTDVQVPEVDVAVTAAPGEGTTGEDGATVEDERQQHTCRS